MQRNTFLSYLFSLLLLAAFLPGGAQASTLVKLAPQSPSVAALSVALASTLPEGWKYLPALDLYIVEDEGLDHLEALKSDGVVEEAEEDAEIQLEALPNDPMVDVQGWISGVSFDIGVEDAWSITTGSKSVVVAMIDTGIAVNHPDLAQNLWTNLGEIAGNGLDDDGNGYVDDVHGFNFWSQNGDVTDQNNHGSHLAGIIGAVGDNGIGVAGINWRVQILPLKFTDAQGNGSSALAVEAIDYAIQQGAHIINASWTLKLDGIAGQSNWQNNSLLKQAIERASDAGILFVTAAGNQFKTYEGLDIDENPVYPASFNTDNMIAVAATNSQGALAGYSNYGPLTVDLAAPGDAIYSTGADGDYIVMSGTSASAAFVSGAAALILSEHPDLSGTQLKAILEGSVEGEASLNGRVLTQGSLNLWNAMTVAAGGSIPLPSTSTSVPETTNPAPSRASFAASGCSLIP